MTTEPPDDTSPNSGSTSPLRMMGGIVMGILAGAVLVVLIGLAGLANPLLAIVVLVASAGGIVIALRRGVHRGSSFRVGFFVGFAALVVLGGGACIAVECAQF